MIAEFTMCWPSYLIGAAVIFTIGAICVYVLLALHISEKAAMRKACREDARRLEQENQELLRKLAELNKPADAEGGG